MPTEISTVITNMATTSMTLLGDVVTNYWQWILGLMFLGYLARKFKGAFSFGK